MDTALAPSPSDSLFSSASLHDAETVVADGPLGSWLFDTDAWGDQIPLTF